MRNDVTIKNAVTFGYVRYHNENNKKGLRNTRVSPLRIQTRSADTGTEDLWNTSENH
jgi:hypothetical protein